MRRPSAVIRPVCGIDNFVEETLRSTFGSIIRATRSCSARRPRAIRSCRWCERLIAGYPACAARLLIGDERISANPKLNNVLKGWRAATRP